MQQAEELQDKSIAISDPASGGLGTEARNTHWNASFRQTALKARCFGVVADVARSNEEADGAASVVGDRVQFGVHASHRAVDQAGPLVVRSHFSGRRLVATRCALTESSQIKTVFGVAAA